MKSFFSVVMYGRGATDDGNYLNYLKSLLRECMNGTDNRPIFERMIAPKIEIAIIPKIANRSMLDSMDDMVDLYEICIQLEEPSSWNFMELINRTAFKTIK